MVKVSPSVLNADFSKANEWLSQFEKAGADFVHWDFMDHVYVPNSGVELDWMAQLREKTRLFFDCHLMVQKPESYIPELVKRGADSATFHVETAKNPLKTISQIRKAGLQVGLAVNANIPVETILPFLEKSDWALVMGVQAGFGGQAFQMQSLEKIAKAKTIIENEGLACEIQIDGGINLETGKKAVQAGADILVAGSFVFKYKNVEEAIRELREL